MKNITFLILFFLVFQITQAQKIDMVNAPRNPIGFKHKKEHFFLRGDIYASSGKIFDVQGNLVYNYGTRYYYDNNGKITGNNYDDTFEYDSRGNIIKFKYKSGSLSNYTFNAKNLLVFEKNTYGDEKTYTYDSQDRIIKTVIDKKGVFYQQRDYSYEKKGNIVIVTTQYTKENRQPGFKGKYHYKNGYLIKEELASGIYNYQVDVDTEGNKIDFYVANDAKAKHYKTFNRYYSDINKPMKLEFGYYIPSGSATAKKIQTVFINGERATDIIISKGVKPNEKLVYDGLTKTYYSVPNVNNDANTVATKIPVTQVISKGDIMISYAHDGKFINYVHGQNKVKSRDFAFLGPHMIDYRIEKSLGRTYVINNYQNIKSQAVKNMKLFTTDESSILYTRELEKENFFIVVKGKHIDYKKARFEYLSNGDPVIFIDDKPQYILTGFRIAKNNEIYQGKLYNGELDNKEETTTSSTVSTTNTTKKASTSTDYDCVKGDCKEGWGRVEVNNIITDATFKDGAINGVAYITYSNGGYYHGQYKNNRRHGVGYYKWSTGNIYVGGWKDGKQHGLGYTMNEKNQITSAGLFENGKLIQESSENYKSGKKNGNCTGDCVDGFGKFEYNNGDIYWGFFKSGKRFGVGTYLWKNKSAYTGAYTADGKRNGYGIYTYVDRSVFKGIFVGDRIDGLGVMKYNKTGNVVQGVFNNKGARVREY
ncbi:MORN repeat-containing protein [Kordia jejudonensis]|uniref:MORN repeat-containing protein n=1 Tax=Kordia jejudonensis TaxID=1348245 RepID=UPI0006292199|nr:MORN motif precursor [Kordia jejudonensis]